LEASRDGADDAQPNSQRSLAENLLYLGTARGMTREEIRDNLGLFAMATAFNLREVLLRVLSHLAASQRWQDRLRASVINDSAERNAVARAIVQECLRLSPLVPLVSRHVEQPEFLEASQDTAAPASTSCRTCWEFPGRPAID
jgi:cytochrome P450